MSCGGDRQPRGAFLLEQQSASLVQMGQQHREQRIARDQPGEPHPVVPAVGFPALRVDLQRLCPEFDGFASAERGGFQVALQRLGNLHSGGHRGRCKIIGNSPLAQREDVPPIR